MRRDIRLCPRQSENRELGHGPARHSVCPLLTAPRLLAYSATLREDTPASAAFSQGVGAGESVAQGGATPEESDVEPVQL